MTRQTYRIEFVVSMDSPDSVKIRKQVSESKSWHKAINELFRHSFDVEVDVEEFHWRADAPASQEENQPWVDGGGFAKVGR